MKVSPLESLASSAGGVASRLVRTSQFPHRFWHLEDFNELAHVPFRR